MARLVDRPAPDHVEALERARGLVVKIREASEPGERIDVHASEPSPAGVLLAELLEVPNVGITLSVHPRIAHDRPTVADVEAAVADVLVL